MRRIKAGLRRPVQRRVSRSNPDGAGRARRYAHGSLKQDEDRVATKWLKTAAWLALLLLVAAVAAAAWYAQRALPRTDGRDRPGRRRRRSAHRARRARHPHHPRRQRATTRCSAWAWRMRRTGCGRWRPTAASAPAGWPRPSATARWRPTASCARWACAAPPRRSGQRLDAGVARRAAGLCRRRQRGAAPGLRARPPEFLILGLQPEPWTPEDSLAWAIMMAWDLGAQLDHRAAAPAPGAAAARGRASTSCCRPTRARRCPRRPTTRRCTAALKARRRQRCETALAAAARARARDRASKAWAPTTGCWPASHTATGKPLLANDPHLKLSRAGAVVLRAASRRPG